MHLPKECNLEKGTEAHTNLEWEKECPYESLDRQPIVSITDVQIRMGTVGFVSDYYIKTMGFLKRCFHSYSTKCFLRNVSLCNRSRGGSPRDVGSPKIYSIKVIKGLDFSSQYLHPKHLLTSSRGG